MRPILLRSAMPACIALSALLTAGPAMAQDTYWLLDGNKHFNTRTHAITPNSSVAPASNPHVRTVYDAGGEELFSYGELDIMWYGVSPNYVGSGEDLGGQQAFAIPFAACKQYYVLNAHLHNHESHASDLTLVKVDASAPGAPKVYAPITLAGNTNAHTMAYYQGHPSYFGAAAARLNADGSRYIYHLTGNTTSTACNLFRFKVNRDGTLPTEVIPLGQTVYDHDTIALGLPLCRQGARIKMAPDGQSMAYTDPSGKLVTYNIATATATSYNVNCLGMAEATLSNGTRRWFVSTGTEMGYVTEGNASSYTMISTTIGKNSEIAEGRDGQFYVAYGTPGTTPGELWSFDATAEAFLATGAYVMGVNGAVPTAYSFGNNVEGSDINAASGVIDTPAVVGINGDVNTSVLQVLSCKPIILENIAHTASTAYVLSISQVNGGGTTLIYHSGAIPVHGYFSSADLHSLTTYLAGNPGIYDVRIIYINSCGANITVTRRIEVLAAPVPSMGIEGSYQTKTSTGSPTVTTVNFGPFTTAPVATVPASPLTVGRTSTIFSVGSASTGGGTATAVCTLEVHIDKAVGGAWVNDIIPYSLYANQCNPWTPPPSMSIGSFSDANGDPFFVAANAPTGSIWRIRIGITNECSTLWRALPFQIGARPTATAFGYLREAGQGAIDEENSVGFAPMPFGNTVTAHLQLTAAAKATMRIFSIDGRLMATPLNDVVMQEGSQNLRIETASWPAGVYFYDCTIGDQHYNGKLAKQ